MAEKRTKAQKRWSKMSDDSDVEKRPFRKGSVSGKVIREQQRDFSKDPQERSDMKRRPNDSPYKRGYFERPYSVIKEHNADYKAAAQYKASKEMDRVSGTKTKYRNPDPRDPEGGPKRVRKTSGKKTATSRKKPGRKKSAPGKR